MIKWLHSMGIKSEYAYAAGFGSTGMTFASWLASRGKPDDSRAQSDRWGIFVGQWAPTFLAVGIALRLEEQKSLTMKK
ncbi:hypothetical protein GCM10007061_10390 [Kocuria marina]|uniref:hypothetical protein n=2 Tax=Kocuria TaxID=57493 RepID=UPI0011A37FB6|nr:hypothetical protein [Kocuria indica]GHD86006.1 hypothetical protein GCM10007061_10390 [Kocuria marina]